MVIVIGAMVVVPGFAFLKLRLGCVKESMPVAGDRSDDWLCAYGEASIESGRTVEELCSGESAAPDGVGDDWVAGEEVFVFDLDEASLNLVLRGLPLFFRGFPGPGRAVGVESFRFGRFDSGWISAAVDESASCRLREAELGIVGGGSGHDSSSESDESSVEALGGSEATSVSRLLVLIWNSVVGSRGERFRGILLFIGSVAISVADDLI